MVLFKSTMATQFPRKARLVADANVWPRTPLLAGPGGVGLALGAVEGIATGLFQLYVTRSLDTMREQCKKMDIASTEPTELAQINTRFVGFFRVMQGISTFIVGRAVSSLADVAMGVVKRSMCASYTVLMTSQALIHMAMINKKDQGKKFKRTLGIQALVYAGIAVLNVLGVAKKGEPLALKV